ncbi:MAG TPA: type IV pilin accessory protein, partial [Patescibacteria group bacterium]|nr:type IV pilin accessory protein [Patescibacteria group bacterium]
MGIRGLNRWQASAGHLGFSVVLGLAVFALFRFLWYPDALFTLAGAGKLLLLVVGIDVVLGPLLTLIVFHPAKKSLIWDLAIIVAVQFGALGYGVWVMAQSRPV